MNYVLDNEEKIYSDFMKDSVQSVLGYKEELHNLEKKRLYDGGDDILLFNECIELKKKINHLISIRTSINVNSILSSNRKTYRMAKKFCFEDAFDLKNFMIDSMTKKGLVYKSDVLGDIINYYESDDISLVKGKRNIKRVKKILNKY